MMRIDVKRMSDADEVLGERAVAKALEARRVTRRTQALLAAAGESGLDRRWAILAVEPRRDNDVDNLLARAMIEHWVPLRKEDRNRQGGRKGTPEEPAWRLAWPGYVFVKIADTAEAFMGVKGVKHVRAVLGVGERPFFMDDGMMLKLKAELAALKPVTGPRTMLRPGEKVTVKDGPFASFPGVVRDCNMGDGSGRDRERATVEVMIFGRAVPVELDLAQLAKRM